MAIWTGDGMSGRVPTWLADWIGASASNTDVATWQLDSAWRWAPWVTVLIVTSAIAFTVVLYTRESTTAGSRYRALLGALRLIAIGLVLIMIAQWALALRLTGPPVIALLVDRSSSMETADRYTDSKLVSQINQQLAEFGLSEATRLNLAKLLVTRNDGRFVKELSERYRLEVYYVDGAVERIPKATDAVQLMRSLRALSASGDTGNATRMGDAVRQVLDDFRAAPPAAIILLSDGVTTEGIPLAAAAEEARRAGVPLIAIGLGRTDPPQDIELADVLVDEAVFVDDVVSFQIQIKASGLANQTAKLTLRRLGADQSISASSNVAEQRIALPPPGQTLTTRLVDRPGEPGNITYIVEIEPHDGEANLDNNRERRTVSVRDEKIRVLLVQAYPSYEFRFLKSLLERDDTVRLSTYLQDADPAFAEQDKTALRSFPLAREELFEYDVLLFGDVDPRLLPRSAWENVRAFVVEKGGGLAFLAGPRFFPWLYADNTEIAALLPVETFAEAASADDLLANDISRGFTVRPTPIGLQNPALQLADTPEATEQIWQQLAPLFWLYEVGKLKPAGQTLAVTGSERAGASPIPPRLPIIAFQYVGPGRVLFHAIDSTWRWRLGVGDAYFSRYWVQMVRFLARGELSSGRGAQLTADRREYRRGDEVQLRARFLDPKLAPANDLVTLWIDSPGQARRRISLHRSPAATGVFEGTVVDLNEGQYEVVMSQPQMPGDPPTTRFVVVALPGELARLEMDAAALAAAAETTRGMFYTIENADQVPADLPAGRRVPLENLPPVSLWNQWWMLAAFLTCITSEWILRRRKGML
jgi:hypothetical protein